MHIHIYIYTHIHVHIRNVAMTPMEAPRLSRCTVQGSLAAAEWCRPLACRTWSWEIPYPEFIQTKECLPEVAVLWGSWTSPKSIFSSPGNTSIAIRTERHPAGMEGDWPSLGA